MQQAGGQQQPGGPVPVEQVLATIRAAMSHIKEEQKPAEALLHSWEEDAAPGFLHSLMLIVQQQTIDEVCVDERRERAKRGEPRGVAVRNVLVVSAAHQCALLTSVLMPDRHTLITAYAQQPYLI